MLSRGLATSSALRLRKASISYVLYVRAYSTPADLPLPKTRKVFDSVDEAVKDVKSGDTLLSGGEQDWAVCRWKQFGAYTLRRHRIWAMRHAWCVFMNGHRLG